jgi:hypothetical protein
MGRSITMVRLQRKVFLIYIQVWHSKKKSKLLEGIER